MEVIMNKKTKKQFFGSLLLAVLFLLPKIQGAKKTLKKMLKAARQRKEVSIQTEPLFANHEPTKILHINSTNKKHFLTFNKHFIETFLDWREIQKNKILIIPNKDANKHHSHVLTLYSKLLELMYQGRMLLIDLTTPPSNSQDLLISELKKSFKRMIQNSIKSTDDLVFLIKFIDATKASILYTDIADYINTNYHHYRNIRYILHKSHFYNLNKKFQETIRIVTKLNENQFSLLVQKPIYIKTFAKKIPLLDQDCSSVCLRVKSIRQTLLDIKKLPSFFDKKYGHNTSYQIKTITLAQQPVTTSTFFKHFKSLKNLFIQSTLINEINGLTNLKNLAQLNINRTLITDLTPLKGHPNLKLLSVANSSIKKFNVLKTLPQLNSLAISFDQFTKIETLLPDLKSLKILVIWTSKEKTLPDKLAGIFQKQKATPSGIMKFVSYKKINPPAPTPDLKQLLQQLRHRQYPKRPTPALAQQRNSNNRNEGNGNGEKPPVLIIIDK